MRVPVGDVSAGVLVEGNVFIICAVLFAAGWWMLSRLARARRDAPGSTHSLDLYAMICGTAAAALCTSGALLELYWMEGCPVADDQFQATVRIFQRNLAFFESQPAGWREQHPHWVAEGSLLAVVRDNPSLNRWDQDSDIFMVYDASGEDPGARFLVEKLRAFHSAELSVNYDPARNFIQVVHPSGGHGDIWLWTKYTKGADTVVLHNPDFTFRSFRNTPNFLPAEWVLPTRTVKWPSNTVAAQSGVGQLELPVPRFHPRVLADQYGPGYLKPYRNRLQCIENFGTKTTFGRKFVCALIILGAGWVAWTWQRRRARGDGKGVPPVPGGARSIWAGAALLLLLLILLLSAGSSHPACPAKGSAGGAVAASRVSPAQLRLWNREGVLQIKGAMSTDEVKRLRRYLTDLDNMPTVRGGVWKYFEEDANNKSRKIINRIEKFTDYHAGLKELVNSEDIRGRAGELLGCTVALFKEKVNYKLPGGGGFEPHQDMQPGWDVYAPQMLTVLLVVDYNSVANGCLEIAPGSHARPGGLIGRMHKPLNETETAGLKWLSLEAEPGDMLFFDAWAPHRSAPNNSTVPRRNTYITFNCREHGDHRQSYYADKYKGLPPDADRDPNKSYRYKV
eukprot:TRINITY_DN7047_c0_g1_i2.p1 TRINITY_DN7047_c0_g1~~TRINITY_DN7047_c0_g1_i2.p1  ORF type:complete len:638 (+),score=180.09 TRINITY_DN7047_c0_g1_i2:52-1914(+)